MVPWPPAPEVHFTGMNFRFPGRGQRNTPVAPARGIVEIIMLLPGQQAARVRAAKTLRRLCDQYPDVGPNWSHLKSADPRSECQMLFGGDVYLSPTPLRLGVRSSTTANSRENSSKMTKARFIHPPRGCPWRRLGDSGAAFGVDFLTKGSHLLTHFLSKGSHD